MLSVGLRLRSLRKRDCTLERRPSQPTDGKTMKTTFQINQARERLKQRIQTPGLNDAQKSLICGMLNALVWAADGEDCSTMERMLSDEPLAAGQDPSRALDRLEQLASGNPYRCEKCGCGKAHSRLRGLFCPRCDMRR